MRPTPRIFTAAVIFAAVLAAPSAAFGQDAVRLLTGTVTDSQHEPLAGAVVQLHDDSTDSVLSYITDRTGRYTFARVSALDDYHVWARFRGHRSRSRFLSKFASKSHSDLTLIVKLE